MSFYEPKFLRLNITQPRVKLTRLRLRVGGAIFMQVFSGKMMLRLQKRRSAYAIVRASMLSLFS